MKFYKNSGGTLNLRNHKNGKQKITREKNEKKNKGEDEDERKKNDTL